MKEQEVGVNGQVKMSHFYFKTPPPPFHLSALLCTETDRGDIFISQQQVKPFTKLPALNFPPPLLPPCSHTAPATWKPCHTALVCTGHSHAATWENPKGSAHPPMLPSHLQLSDKFYSGVLCTPVHPCPTSTAATLTGPCVTSSAPKS